MTHEQILDLIGQYQTAVKSSAPPKSLARWCKSAGVTAGALNSYVHADGTLKVVGKQVSNNSFGNKKWRATTAEDLKAWKVSKLTRTTFVDVYGLNLRRFQVLARSDHSLSDEGEDALLRAEGHEFDPLREVHIKEFQALAGKTTSVDFCKDNNLSYTYFRHMVHLDGTLSKQGSIFMSGKQPAIDPALMSSVTATGPGKDADMDFDFECDLEDCDLDLIL